MNLVTAPTDTSGNTYVPQYVNYQLDEEELRTQLTRRDTQLSIALNLKENGIFENVETQSSQQWFPSGVASNPKRFGFRKVFQIGAITAGAAGVPIAHGITGATIFTYIGGGVITDQPDFRSLDHASVTANANIEVIVTDTTYTIKVGAASPNVTSGVLVLEYLKN